jgi:hypothetical protein
MDESKFRSREREAENQALFREVNERIEAVNDSLSVGSDLDANIEFFCECGAVGCASTIRLTRAEYEAVRAHPRRFVVLPGHGRPDVDRVVETRDGYAVVEIFGEAAEVAESSNPRTES